MRKMTKYPSFDVMAEQEHWDPHTQSIVNDRLVRQPKHQVLSLEEAELLRSWCSRLVDDDRAEMINYVIEHIDTTLSSGTGEGQRKPEAPHQRELILQGLHAVDKIAEGFHGQPFHHLRAIEQQEIMKNIAEARLSLIGEWTTTVQNEWFSKLLKLTVEAYYSHPVVWSEIGYAGPAYPRGYVRTDRGQLDPWEAKPEL
ncbi:gluconate 2-dehydrogenase subunit 3 family protein [Paenibacillus lutrae]|uniref:Gluconate 2-dehydrogenase subunit 3 family protein n=1 Tax=Paenibacillus lutrae TaxID=2078573 RepID=A0A7X3FKE1_9BACL|nr:gluconate 2-dehydrogenase subunit 3 family protein [Paenibacillus lutrae]MVP01227.1 gluconate 2-dehydrogenase subunit 3 family protein [Paenibacillus lutrae]